MTNMKLTVAAAAEIARTPSYAKPAHCPGYHRSWDTDYDCGGCYGCTGRRMNLEAGWSIGAFVYAVATGAERARLEATVTAMRCLASIGKAITAALAPGAGVSAFFSFAVDAWNEIRKGRWYRIIATRGKAKSDAGKIGRVAWLGETTYGGRYYNRIGFVGGRTSERAGLVLEGVEGGGLTYVGTASLEPVAEPEHARVARLAAEAKKAERATFKPFTGCKGTFAYVIDGAHKGKSGVVIWTGTTANGKARVGILPGVTKLPKGRSEGALWIDAVDVTADAPAPVGSELSIEVEVVIMAIARIIQLALDAAGVPDADRAAGFAPEAKRTRKPRNKAASAGGAA
jgi:hypothetical protein